MRRFVGSFVMLAGLASACGGAAPSPGTPGTPHGRLTEMSRVEGDIVL